MEKRDTVVWAYTRKRRKYGDLIIDWSSGAKWGGRIEDLAQVVLTYKAKYGKGVWAIPVSPECFFLYHIPVEVLDPLLEDLLAIIKPARILTFRG